MTRELVLYRPTPPTEGPRSISSASSYTVRPGPSTHSGSSHRSRLAPETPRSVTHVSNARYPAPRSNYPSSCSTAQQPRAASRHDSPSSHGGSSRDSGYSSGSSYTRITAISTQTFGSPNHPGYVHGQAPRRYFHSVEVRRAWDNAPVNPDGVRIRLGSGGRELEIGTECSSGRGMDVGPPMISSANSGRATERRPRRQLEQEETWDEDTVVPDDSISMVSSRRSRDAPARSHASGQRTRRYHYPGSEHSQRYDCKLEENGVEVSNDKFVRERRPDWVY